MIDIKTVIIIACIVCIIVIYITISYFIIIDIMIYIITTYIIILYHGKFNFLKVAMLQKCPVSCENALKR